MRMVKGNNEAKKIILGSVAAIAMTTMVFSGISQTVKAAELGKTNAVPTSYNIPYTGPVSSSVPKDYVKQDYEIKSIGQNRSTVNDMGMVEAAELASQNLWRIFQVDLGGRTLEMSYDPISTTQQRAIWNVHVKINNTLSYDFALDAVTGENHAIAKRVYHKADIPEGMDKSLLENNQEYQQLAKAAAEKYQLVASTVTAVDYISQGFQEDAAGAKNSNITFQVKAENGEVAQLTFSRFNKELLSVEYSNWLKEAEQHERLIESEMNSQSEKVVITDELLKKIQEDGPITRNSNN